MESKKPINHDNSSFKDSLGRYLTIALFYETATGSKEEVVYTLKEKDYKGFLSIKRLYLEMEDITEYEFANKYFENWSHWKKLIASAWFKEHIDVWREELELKFKARSLNQIKRTAKSSAKEAFMANKYLLEKGWEKSTKDKSTVGRPTQEKIKQEAQRLHDEKEIVEKDAQRLLN